VGALVLGVVALVWGGLAFAVATAEGLTVGRMTGFLLVPAGAALLALAARSLWLSRRPGRFRYLRAALYAVIGLLAIYWVILPLGLAAYATHRPRVTVSPQVEELPQYEEVMLRTADGVSLYAWYIPSQNGAAVITFPRETTLPHAAMLARHGYRVLLLDLRGYGRSEGDPNAFGWGSSRDVDAAVAYLDARPDVDRAGVGGLGLSVGGEQMIEAAAGNTGLKAVVSEGAGERSVRESLIRGPRGYLAVPAMAVQTATLAVLTGEAPPASLEHLAAQVAPRALFLIYAEEGGGGEELNTDYYDAAGRPKEIWMVEGSGHIGGLAEAPEEYERRVTGFFDEFLLAR
jgi:pimeloyl-ACP methyl ester carboxylesterase